MEKRNEKIKFLKGVLSGTRMIFELVPREHFVFHLNDEKQLYRCEKLGLEFTKEEYKKFQREHPNADFMVIRRQIIRDVYT